MKHKHQWTTRRTINRQHNAPGLAPDGTLVYLFPGTRYCHLCGQWQQIRRFRWRDVTREAVVQSMLERGMTLEEGE